MEKPTWCTQFSDQECSKENCCLEMWKNPESYIAKHGYIINPKKLENYEFSTINNPKTWSISCEK